MVCSYHVRKMNNISTQIQIWIGDNLPYVFFTKHHKCIAHHRSYFLCKVSINFKDKSLKLFVVCFCDLIERLDLEMVTLDVTYIKHLTKIQCHTVRFTSIMSWLFYWIVLYDSQTQGSESVWWILHRMNSTNLSEQLLNQQMTHLLNWIITPLKPLGCSYMLCHQKKIYIFSLFLYTSYSCLCW